MSARLYVYGGGDDDENNDYDGGKRGFNIICAYKSKILLRERLKVNPCKHAQLQNFN